MKKQILTFTSLEEMARFAKLLQGGYVLNTITLTMTITLSECEDLKVVKPEHQTSKVVMKSKRAVSQAM